MDQVESRAAPLPRGVEARRPAEGCGRAARSAPRMDCGRAGSSGSCQTWVLSFSWVVSWVSADEIARIAGRAPRTAHTPIEREVCVRFAGELRVAPPARIAQGSAHVRAQGVRQCVVTLAQWACSWWSWGSLPAPLDAALGLNPDELPALHEIPTASPHLVLGLAGRLSEFGRALRLRLHEMQDG